MACLCDKIFHKKGLCLEEGMYGDSFTFRPRLSVWIRYKRYLHLGELIHLVDFCTASCAGTWQVSPRENFTLDVRRRWVLEDANRHPLHTLEWARSCYPHCYLNGNSRLWRVGGSDADALKICTEGGTEHRDGALVHSQESQLWPWPCVPFQFCVCFLPCRRNCLTLLCTAFDGCCRQRNTLLWI